LFLEAAPNPATVARPGEGCLRGYSGSELTRRREVHCGWRSLVSDAKTLSPRADARLTGPAAAADFLRGLQMSKTGLEFSVGDHVVYPAHGVGQVQGIETQEVAGLSLEVYVITFDHEKMTLRVPTGKARSSGLRSLAEGNVVSQALTTLKGRARVKRTMWSRRAQEYEAKINSGDLISIAEVVRDLHRAENQPEQSYSERQLYESALDRMAREVAAIERIDREAAIGILNKSLVKAVAA
jgi:CarD family transcriptional regulator